MGFLPGSDPRLLATVDAIEQGLSNERGLVYRYRGDDGFDEPEGTFLLCTFWLAAHALAHRASRPDPAHAGPGRRMRHDPRPLRRTGRPASGELLGNFPQAFSHLGLLDAAQALADAEGQLRA